MFKSITVITPLLKKQVVENFGFKDENVDIWTSGVNLEIYDKDSLRPINDGIFESRFTVMYHGTLSMSRGLLESVEAIKLVKDDIPDVLLLILGSGRAREKIKSLIDKHELADKVMLKNSVKYNHVPKYISKCDVGILAYPRINYWQTSSPIKLFEYFAMRKPVIVTELVAFRDVIGKENCGIFIESNKPAQIAQAIRKAYQMRPKLPEMGSRGRSIVELNYTWRAQAQRYASFLRKLVRN